VLAKHSCNYCVDRAPNVIPIKGFDASNSPIYYIEYYHSFFGTQRYISMVRAVTAFRFRPHIERTAEIISATAAVKNSQGRHLSCEFGFSLLQEKFLKFLNQWGQYVGQQWRFGGIQHHLCHSEKVRVSGVRSASLPDLSIPIL
jgi:hypothetical protein